MAESIEELSFKHAFRSFYERFKQSEISKCEGSNYVVKEKNVINFQNDGSLESYVKKSDNSSNRNLNEAPRNRPNKKIQEKKISLNDNTDLSKMNWKNAIKCSSYTADWLLFHNSPDNLEFSRHSGFDPNASRENKKKQKNNQSEKPIPIPVPEWNKVFKEILGSDSSAKKKPDGQDTLKETNEPVYDASVGPKPMYKPFKLPTEVFDDEVANEPKYDGSVRPKNKKSFKIPTKVFEDEEEDNSEEGDDDDPLMQEAKAAFARARLFKRPHVYRINDFEGMGIDCFKDDKPLSHWAAAIPPADLLEDNHPELLPFKGHVAPYKPYTTEDIQESYRRMPPFEEEAWDDDLLL